MPYVPQTHRADIDSNIDQMINQLKTMTASNPSALAGDLNYAITRIIDGVYPTKRYNYINEAIGVLECAKLELYRRLAAPYEDLKMQEHGDAYGLSK